MTVCRTLDNEPGLWGNARPRIESIADVDVVPDLIAYACERFSDRAAVISGDRVAALAMNEVEYLEIQVAAMRSGAILVPLNFRLAAPELLEAKKTRTSSSVFTR